MPDLRLHLLLPSPDGTRILATPDGALPAYEVGISPGDTAVMAARRVLVEQLGLDVPVLETHLPPDDDSGHPAPADHQVTHSGAVHDDGTDPGDGGARPSPSIALLAVCERAAPGWSPPRDPPCDPPGDPPGDLQWLPLEAARELTGVPAALAPRVATWLDELRVGGPPPALRPRWSRPGWHRRATDWIRSECAAAGRELVGEIEVRRLWGISALLRAHDRDGGGVWFKAVFPPFDHEPAVTAYLAGLAPGQVPRVIAREPDEGWLLLDDVAAAPRPDDAGRSVAGLTSGIRALVALQRDSVDRRSELVALGCPQRPLTALADDLGRALAEVASLTGTGPAPARSAALLAWVRERSAWLAGFGLTEVLLHGDFHTDNVIAAAQGPVIIDWSDAALAHPLMDVAAFFDDVDEPALRQPCWLAWLDALAALGPAHLLRHDLDTVRALADAYQVVSYANIVRNLEPANRYQLSEDLLGFLQRLDASVPR